MVWEHVRDSPDACPFCDWRTYAPVALAGMAREPLLHLISLASGNSPAAAHTVVLLARQLTKFLAEETERNLDLYRGIAEREFAWPMLVARKNEHNDSVNALRKKLNLGAKGFDPRQVRGRVRETRGRTLDVVALLVRLEELRRNYLSYITDIVSNSLPVHRPSGPFSESNAKEWAEGIWQLLCRDFDGHPENDPKLRAIGKHRAGHYLQPNPTGRSIAKTESSNIADGIKAELEKAVMRLAKGQKTRKVPGK